MAVPTALRIVLYQILPRTGRQSHRHSMEVTAGVSFEYVWCGVILDPLIITAYGRMC